MIPDDLLAPEAWPDPRPTRVERIETHASWVLRGDRHVLKIKKPVDLGFLDFTSAARRRQACEDEVHLNARLAPGVYLGVVPIVEGPGGASARPAPDARRAIDWAVRMTRLDDARRADTMLGARSLEARHVDALAGRIAAFHGATAVDALEGSRWASHSAVMRNVHENFQQTRAVVDDYVSRRVSEEAEVRQMAFLRRNADRFAARVATDRVCDGHGDLRLEHVYFEDAGIRVIDCIEFDPRYRVSDACADVAFLAMDFESHERADLGERFLARYARASGDYDLYAMVDFYAAYRAWVRGKVSAILAHDERAPVEARERAATEARRHFLLAVAATRPALVSPTLVCVGGLIGSGKSTIADAIADELSCPVVDADRTRKHLMGVAEDVPLVDPSWRGAYDPSTTRQVYEEVLQRSATVIESGRSVVIDASFRSRSMRREARELARSHGMRFRFVECQAPADVCKRRLEARALAPSQSDGRVGIFDDFAAHFERVDELGAAEHVPLDTTRSVEQSIAEVRTRIVTWPRGLVA